MGLFQKATRKQLKLRLALVGPTGSGKTKTALLLAAHLGKRVAVIDTENRSASKYIGEPGVPDFDVCELDSYEPRNYVEAITEAERQGYDVVIVDGITQAWSGKNGALELVDKAAKRSQSGNSFTAWRDVSPMHNGLVESLVQCRAHLIVTMRAKMEYVLDEDSRGKKMPRKVGLAPVQRDGMEYEFDVVGDLDVEHNLMISKTRCSALDGYVENKPGRDFAERLLAWLNDGAPVAAKPPAGLDEYGLQVPKVPCPIVPAGRENAGKAWHELPGWLVQKMHDESLAKMSANGQAWATYLVQKRAARKAREAAAEAEAAERALAAQGGARPFAEGEATPASSSRTSSESQSSTMGTPGATSQTSREGSEPAYENESGCGADAGGAQ